MTKINKVFRFLLLLVICLSASFFVSESASAYKVYEDTTRVISGPFASSSGAYITMPIHAVKSARVSKQLHSWTSKTVSVEQAKTPSTSIRSYRFSCPGYYTVRLYSDSNFKISVGFMQVYISKVDSPRSGCAGVTAPQPSRPATEEEPDPPIPDPPTKPKPPKLTHPHPKVEAQEKPKIIKPAPKPTPQKPKPPVTPPPAPVPEETEAQKKIRIANEACKRAAEQAYDKWERNKMTSSAGNNDATVVGEDGMVYQTVMTKKMTWQAQQDSGVMNPYEPYDESYSFNLTGDGQSYECCPIADGVSQAFWKNVDGVNYYQCWNSERGNLSDTYCLDAGDANAKYNNENDSCEVEEGGGYDYEVEEGEDIGTLPLEYDDYLVREFSVNEEANMIEVGYMESEEDLQEAEPPVDGGDNPSGGCELCALFECPGWSDFVDVISGGGGGITENEMAGLIGDVVTPPVPNLPRPSIPDLFETLNDVNGRDGTLTKPTGDDGIGDSTFDADDIKNEAPVIPVAPDESGGFNVVNPVEALPDNYDDAPVPEPSEPIPLPESDYNNYAEFPSPTPETDTTATPPTEYDDLAIPPTQY